MPITSNGRNESKNTGFDGSASDGVDNEAMLESVSDEANGTLGVETNHLNREEGKPRVVVPASVDSTQQEALLLLKKLKFYAALAEVGIVRSKLSIMNFDSDLDDSANLDGAKFLPERFISRQDLIDWKAKLEYGVIAGINEEISRNNLGLIDAREIRTDALVELFIDMLVGDKSIMRNVFGQGKRFQPGQPSTKAQAAVALTSGRMTQAILTELLRLEGEKSSRLSAMEEIKSELLERGNIKRQWARKMDEVKRLGLEVERVYHAVIEEFEQEKIVQERAQVAHSKEKAAIDCRTQLLSRLKQEIDEMTERPAQESAEFVDEQHDIPTTLCEVQSNYEQMFDAKSILEAELEAVRIPRSWVEDEARKNQTRAKVLEEAGWRWKWEDHS